MNAYFSLHGNNVQYSGQNTIILSSFFNGNDGVYSYPFTARINIALFCSRRLIKSYWNNHDDCYIAPSKQKGL